MAEAKEIIITNGRVVTPEGVNRKDIQVRSGIIAGIGGPFDDMAADVIDARGHYVMPGGVDVHTHFNLDVGIAVAQDDFYTGTAAAALGGTTTIVDHPGFGPAGCSLFHQIEIYHGYAAGKAVVDYGFHGVLQHLDDTVLEEIPGLAEQGITSMKAYMTYDYRFTPEMLAAVLSAAKDAGMLVAVHAEDHDTVQRLRQQYVREGKSAAIYHARSRPAETEGKAVQAAIVASSKAGNAPLYIVHLTTRDGLAHVRAAKSHGARVYAETCPQYLLLDEEKYNEPDHGGLKYIMSPPLREKQHRTALEQGLADGSIQVLATDHCPFDFALKKKLAKDDFTRCPGGAPGVEARVPLMFTKCVTGLGMDITAFSELISGNPAKLMGLYPQKGVIATGSDADLIILDPEKEMLLAWDMLHENVDYTPYDGITVRGWPWLTMVRGRVAAENGQLLAPPGWGRFIKRKQTQPLS